MVSSKHKALIIGLASFIYYAVLSAKTWTWVFVGMDSGDYLSSVILNMTPHPYGSPLYILLGELLYLFPVDLIQSMTIVLSALPAAITVALIFLIIRREVSEKVALICSLVVLGCGVFLTQSTILEIYSLTIMFITAGVYFYQQGSKKLWLLMMGLGSAVHVIVGIITITWLVIDRANWREYLKSSWVFILPMLTYFHTLWTMSLDAPKLFAGDLTLEGILLWAGGTDRIGTMAVVDIPKRAFDFSVVMLSSFGLALIPMWLGIKERKLYKLGAVSLTGSMLAVFLYVTNLDMITWTYIMFGVPFMALLVAYGLSKVNAKLVTAGAVILIVLNAYFLNADLLTKKEPLATEFERAVMSVPDGSAVLIPAGATTGSGLFYLLSKKDILPIIMNMKPTNANFKVYTDWVNDKYSVEGETTLELAQNAAFQGRNIYVASPVVPVWQKALFTVDTDSTMLLRVWCINMSPGWTEDEINSIK